MFARFKYFLELYYKVFWYTGDVLDFFGFLRIQKGSRGIALLFHQLSWAFVELFCSPANK